MLEIEIEIWNLPSTGCREPTTIEKKYLFGEAWNWYRSYEIVVPQRYIYTRKEFVHYLESLTSLSTGLAKSYLF